MWMPMCWTLCPKKLRQIQKRWIQTGPYEQDHMTETLWVGPYHFLHHLLDGDEHLRLISCGKKTHSSAKYPTFEPFPPNRQRQMLPKNATLGPQHNSCIESGLLEQNIVSGQGAGNLSCNSSRKLWDFFLELWEDAESCVKIDDGSAQISAGGGIFCLLNFLVVQHWRIYTFIWNVVPPCFW